jgi:hypothetical protein
VLRRIDENNELKNDRFTPTWEEVREHVLLLVCHMYKRDPKWQMKNEVTHGHEPPTPQVTPIGQTFDIQRTTVAELEFEGKLSYRFRDSEPRMIARLVLDEYVLPKTFADANGTTAAFLSG